MPTSNKLKEGDPCTLGEDECDGALEVVQGRECACMDSPPCWSCIEDGLACDECGHRPYDDL